MADRQRALPRAAPPPAAAASPRLCPRAVLPPLPPLPQGGKGDGPGHGYSLSSPGVFGVGDAAGAGGAHGRHARNKTAVPTVPPTMTRALSTTEKSVKKQRAFQTLFQLVRFTRRSRARWRGRCGRGRAAAVLVGGSVDTLDS